MESENGLESRQYERQYWEDEVPLKDVRQSTLRRFVYIGAALFMLIVIAGFTIRFPDEVRLDFVLRGEQPEHIYRFPYPVYIEERFLIPGQKVQPGAPLLRITAPQIVQLISDYEQAERALTNYRAHKPRALADTREMVQLEASQNAHRLAEIGQQQSALQSTWKSNESRLRFELENAEKQYSQHQALYQTKAISALELKTFEASRVRAEDALHTAREAYLRDMQALREEAARYQLQNRSLAREEERYTLEAGTDSADLVNRMNVALDQIHHSFGTFKISGGSLILKAAARGEASFIFEGEREVPASAILLKIAEESSGLYAFAPSPSSVIGKLRKGQTAYLKVETFPAYEWGAAKGHIESLSLAPDEKGSFPVRVTIDDPRKLERLLQAGMTGTVNIQLSERTFFQYFFRNLKKMGHQMSGE